MVRVDDDICYYLSSVVISACMSAREYECAFTSPMRTECGMFVMCCMQHCLSMSTVL